MGDPKKIRKKFMTPKHPWQKARIDEERDLKREYGLKNKREIWKQQSVLKRFIDNYKKTGTSAQFQKEREELLTKMTSLGIIKSNAKADDILGLHLKDVLERRLQTILCRKSMAHSMKQARQFIVHRHIAVDGQVITSPAYLVPVEEQNKITFVNKSPLSDEMHPERVTPEQQEAQRIKESAGKPAKQSKDDVGDDSEESADQESSDDEEVEIKVKEPIDDKILEDIPEDDDEESGTDAKADSKPKEKAAGKEE